MGTRACDVVDQVTDQRVDPSGSPREGFFIWAPRDSAGVSKARQSQNMAENQDNPYRCPMTFIERLTAALPVTSVESDVLGHVSLRSNETVLDFWQPLAGASEVLVDPAQALSFVCAASNWPNSDIIRVAIHLLGDLSIMDRPRLADISGSRVCVPVSKVLDRVSNHERIQKRVLDFVARAADATACHPVFSGEGISPSWNDRVPMLSLPKQPPPIALMECEVSTAYNAAWLASVDQNNPDLHG